uniref:5-hydroxytryptamine receptor 7 n=1 Tax=Cyclopterus lumpus TaxID=8103 RepID=A0A8C3AUL8_CYCLU
MVVAGSNNGTVGSGNMRSSFMIEDRVAGGDSGDSTIVMISEALAPRLLKIAQGLRQPSNYLIVSLAVADLSVALAVMPFVSITDLIGGQWIFGQFFCNVFIAMDVMCCTASIMSLCVISIDRYLGITKPLTYPVKQNGCCMAKMVLSVWLLSASITLPPLFGWAQNVNDGRVCLISQDFGYTVYSTAVAFYIPMSVMLIMYNRIYRAAKLSAAKHTITCFPREGERGTGEHHQRRKRKNQSIFKREQKAAATLGIVVGAFTFCWLPFFLVSTARPFVCGVECSCVPLWLERTLLWLGYANSLINPFIYAFFNRDLRTTYSNLLRCRYRNINRKLSACRAVQWLHDNCNGGCYLGALAADCYPTEQSCAHDVVTKVGGATHRLLRSSIAASGNFLTQ